MPWNVTDWLDRQPSGLDIYAVLGRKRFDADRPGLLQTIKDANRQLHAYQDHHDRHVSELALAWQRAVAAAAGMFHDRTLLTAQHANLLDKLKSQAECEFGPLAKTPTARLRHWLLDSQQVDRAQVDFVVKALTKEKQADCLAALERTIFPQAKELAAAGAEGLHVVGHRTPQRKPRRDKRAAQQPAELVEVDDDSWNDEPLSSAVTATTESRSKLPQWHCKLSGEWTGPFDAGEVDYLCFRGQITAETEVRRDRDVVGGPANELLPEHFPPPVEKRVVPAPVELIAEQVEEPATNPFAPPASALLPNPSPQPLRRPFDTEQTETALQRRSKQVLLGAGIGMLAATIIFLLLLALLTFGGNGDGGLAGGGKGGGRGSGEGTGTGPGKGSGSGGGEGSGKGAGKGSGTAPGNRPSAASDVAKNEATKSAEPPAAEAEVVLARNPERSAFQRPDVPPATTPPSTKVASSEGDAYGASGGGGGGGGGSWDGMLGTLRRQGLDIVLCFDSTGSMGGEIEQVKRQIERIGEVLVKLIPKTRIGVCTYRDRGDEYVVKGLPLTTSIQEISDYLNDVRAGGGGDAPEAVDEGLDWSSSKNQFRPTARKVILVFGDAPPHSDKLQRCLKIAADFHKRQKGIVSTVTCHSGAPLGEFVEIAQVGGGEAFLTTNEREIMTQLLVLVFGSQHRAKVLEAFKLLDK